MPPPLFFLLLGLLSILPFVHSSPAARAFLLNCGASDEIRVDSQKWSPDEGFVQTGNKSTLKATDLLPTLTTLRYFPDAAARKYCYVFPVRKGERYLIRTTFFYGGFDGGEDPPVFDQIVEGTRWATVNTTEDYAAGLSSYYEIVMEATRKTMSVCLARNNQTAPNSSPFISALELNYLADSLYNATDFGKYALSTVARHSFGDDGGVISFPDDQFNRFWQPFTDANPRVESHRTIAPEGFWNVPPEVAMQTGITTSRGKKLELRWPPPALPAGRYYVALYFQDNRTPSPYSWRVFDVFVNEEEFYADLNVTAAGVAVYAAAWPLSGETRIAMKPNPDQTVGPVINAGEVLQIVPLGGRTVSRDVSAMEDLARSFNNPPSDWKGDPCMPPENAWTGVTCSSEKVTRVVTLNLTSAGISGSLPSSIDSLTGLVNLWLGGNELSGTIPEMTHLTMLQTLHLEDNQLEGSIPKSLGSLPEVNQIYLQNNKLEGPIPETLQNRKGMELKVSPGNQLSEAAAGST